MSIPESILLAASHSWARRAMKSPHYAAAHDMVLDQLPSMARGAVKGYELIRSDEKVAIGLGNQIATHARLLSANAIGGSTEDQAHCATALGVGNFLRDIFRNAGERDGAKSLQALTASFDKHPELAKRAAETLQSSPDGRHFEKLNRSSPGEVAAACRDYLENASCADAAIFGHRLIGMEVPPSLYTLSAAESRTEFLTHAQMAERDNVLAASAGKALPKEQQQVQEFLKDPAHKTILVQWEQEWAQHKRSGGVVTPTEMREQMEHMRTDMQKHGLSLATAQHGAAMVGKGLEMADRNPASRPSANPPRAERWAR